MNREPKAWCLRPKRSSCLKKKKKIPGLICPRPLGHGVILGTQVSLPWFPCGPRGLSLDSRKGKRRVEKAVGISKDASRRPHGAPLPELGHMVTWSQTQGKLGRGLFILNDHALLENPSLRKKDGLDLGEQALVLTRWQFRDPALRG